MIPSILLGSPFQCRHCGYTPAVVGDYHGRFASNYESVGAARREVVHFAADHGFAECSLGDIENAVGEALANAAEHGHCQDGEIGVHAYVEGQALVIDIEDRGAGFDTSRAAGDMRPSPTASRGFGIFLMRELMDGVEFDDSGARVRLVKRLPLDG